TDLGGGTRAPPAPGAFRTLSLNIKAAAAARQSAMSVATNATRVVRLWIKLGDASAAPPAQDTMPEAGSAVRCATSESARPLATAFGVVTAFGTVPPALDAARAIGSASTLGAVPPLPGAAARLVTWWSVQTVTPAIIR